MTRTPVSISEGSSPALKFLKILNALTLFSLVIIGGAIATIMLSRGRFEEIQQGLSLDSHRLMDSWFADILVRPAGLILIALVATFIVYKEYRLESLGRRFLVNLLSVFALTWLACALISELYI
jgi:uncharacterized protein YacL